MITTHVVYSKWGGTAHWSYDVFRLGEDEHGVWVGGPAGLTLRRPGVEAVLGYPSVQLFPRDEPWVAAFNADAPGDLRPLHEVYIDMATPPQWSSDGTTVTMVDLDLDVVRLWDGAVEILDEDEFAVHQRELGYPSELVELARRSCVERAAALGAGEEPFASAYRRWLALVP